MLIPYITVDDHIQTSLSISSEMERLEMVTNMNELAFVTSSEVSDSEGHSVRAPVEWIVSADHVGEQRTYTVYSGTSPYGHLTSMVTSPLRSPYLSPKLYSTVQIMGD